jgi:hypothetical protein
MQYRIYYRRWMTPLRAGRSTPFVPGETHRFIRSIEAGSLGEVYHRMQGGVWSPRGEARPVIERAGVRHTSMSAGDVAVDEAGRAWMCTPLGWEEIPLGEVALILACSASKRDPAGLPHVTRPIHRGEVAHDDTDAVKAPAVLVYDGPQWRIIRRWNPSFRVFALSGKYGLFDARLPIQHYDARMADHPPYRWIYYQVLFGVWRTLQHYDTIWTCVPGGGYASVVNLLDETLRMGGYAGRIESATTLLDPGDRQLPAHFARTKVLSLLCRQYARGRMPEAETIEDWAGLVLAGRILA